MEPSGPARKPHRKPAASGSHGPRRNQPAGRQSFFSELKRRNVIRLAGLYLVASWLIVQVTTTILPMFGAPEWLPRTVVVMLAVIFVPALVFSWVYEITPAGIKREREVAPHESITPETGQRMNRAIVALLVLAVGIFAVDRFMLTPKREAARLAVAPAAPAAPATPAVSANSIAVLPFLDMSQAKDQEYFSDGLSEELLDLLAKVPDLRVIARTSSFSFKGKNVDIATIAKVLNVAHVLEGSVRKSGNTLRITAQLIRTADSTHLWSETYERELTDVFEVQDDIAAAVVAALKVKLLNAQGIGERRTRNIDAHNEYLLGKQAYHRVNLEGWRRAEVAFRRAVALDPGYAPAWAGLARSLHYLSDFGDDAAAMAAMKREAIVDAERAVALAPDLADAYEARAHMRLALSFDWKGAESDLERASCSSRVRAMSCIAVRYCLPSSAGCPKPSTRSVLRRRWTRCRTGHCRPPARISPPWVAWTSRAKCCNVRSRSIPNRAWPWRRWVRRNCSTASSKPREATTSARAVPGPAWARL